MSSLLFARLPRFGPPRMRSRLPILIIWLVALSLTFGGSESIIGAAPVGRRATGTGGTHITATVPAVVIDRGGQLMPLFFKVDGSPTGLEFGDDIGRPLPTVAAGRTNRRSLFGLSSAAAALAAQQSPHLRI